MGIHAEGILDARPEQFKCELHEGKQPGRTEKEEAPSSLVRTAAPLANQPMSGSSSDATRPAMAVWTTTSFNPLYWLSSSCTHQRYIGHACEALHLRNRRVESKF